MNALTLKYNALVEENKSYIKKNSDLIFQIDDFKKETINIKVDIEAKFLAVIEKIKIEYENKLQENRLQMSTLIKERETLETRIKQVVVTEKVVEKIVYQDKIVERIVEKPVERIVYQEKIVERIVEKPVERIVYQEKIVEKIVENNVIFILFI